MGISERTCRLSNLYIRATSELKGELVLASVNRSLRKGEKLPINEKLFWNDDIQRALSLNFIETVGDVPTLSGEASERIVIRSLFRGDHLVLPSIPTTLRYGQEFEISGVTANNLDIRQAHDRGIIEFVGRDSAPIALTDTDVNDLLAALEGAKSPQEEEVELDEAEQFKLTGEAKVVEREKPVVAKDSNYTPFDPTTAAAAERALAPAAAPKKGGRKTIKANGRVKTAGLSTDQENVQEDDGVEITILSDGHSKSV